MVILIRFFLNIDQFDNGETFLYKVSPLQSKSKNEPVTIEGRRIYLPPNLNHPQRCKPNRIAVSAPQFHHTVATTPEAGGAGPSRRHSASTLTFCNIVSSTRRLQFDLSYGFAFHCLLNFAYGLSSGSPAAWILGTREAAS
jgi:hypothetical protein